MHRKVDFQACRTTGTTLTTTHANHARCIHTHTRKARWKRKRKTFASERAHGNDHEIPQTRYRIQIGGNVLLLLLHHDTQSQRNTPEYQSISRSGGDEECEISSHGEHTPPSKTCIISIYTRATNEPLTSTSLVPKCSLRPKWW